MGTKDRLTIWLVAAMLIAVASCVCAQTSPTAGSVPQTGLLPVYGVDFSFDPAWVDGSAFPSSSPNFGVNPTFQQVWDSLKPTGFNCIRFRLDVMDEQSANRTANLCLWAAANGVKFVPVLAGPSDDSLSTSAAAFAKALATTIRKDPQGISAYGQILAFQVGDRMNHAGLHGAVSTDTATKTLLKAASAVRAAEQEALKDAGLYASPIMIDLSFDYELVKAKAMAGVTLNDAIYDSACQSTRQFVGSLVSSPDIDIINVEWFAGSIGAGTVDKLPELLRSLKSDFAGKQFVFTTGFSTGFNPPADQSSYYAAAFTNLAQYRVQEASDGAFLGVFFHDVMDSAESDPAPPTEDLPSKIAQWDRSAKSDEMAAMWAGGAKSDDLAWWLSKSENHMGLISMKSDPTAGSVLTPQPGHEALIQIAGAVTEANAAVAAAPPEQSPTDPNAATPPAGDPSAGSASSGPSFKSKVKEGLMGLMDRVFQKIGDKITAFGTGSGGGGFAPPADTGYPPPDPGAVPPPAATPPSVSVALAPSDVSFNPSSPKVGEQVTASIIIHNQSPNAQASGLSLGLVDANGFLIDPATQQSGIDVPANGTKKVDLSWKPGLAGTVSILADVYDAAIVKVASTNVDLTVSAASPGSDAPPPSTPTGGFTLQGVTVQPGSPKVGQHAKFSVDVKNEGDAASNLDVFVINPADAMAALAGANVSSVGKGQTKKVDLSWLPGSEGPLSLEVQLWDSGGMLASKPIGVTVVASGGGGSAGPGDVSVPHLPRLKIPRPGPLVSKLPLGLPTVRDLNFGEGTPMSGSLTVNLVNPYEKAISSLSAALMMDGKQMQTKSLAGFLPGQNRSVVFSGIKPPQSGKHVFQIVLKGGKLTGTVAGEMDFSAGALGARGGKRPMVKKTPLIQTAALRSALPSTFNIGGKQVIAQAPLALPPTAKPAVRPVTPGGAFTPPPTTQGTALPPAIPGVRPVVLNGAQTGQPGINTTPGADATKTVPTIPGVTAAPTVAAARPTVPVIPGVTPTVQPNTRTVAPAVVPTVKPNLPAGTQTAPIMTPTAPITAVKRPTPTTPTGTAQPTAIPGIRPTVPAGTAATGTTPTTPTAVKPATETTRPAISNVVPALIKPDLCITSRDIRYTPSPVKAGDPVSFAVTVRNLAEAAADGARVMCVLKGDGRQAAQKEFTVNMASKGSAPVQWQVTTPKARQVTLEVVVTHAADSSAANNRAVVTLSLSN